MLSLDSRPHTRSLPCLALPYLFCRREPSIHQSSVAELPFGFVAAHCGAKTAGRFENFATNTTGPERDGVDAVWWRCGGFGSGMGFPSPFHVGVGTGPCLPLSTLHSLGDENLAPRLTSEGSHEERRFFFVLFCFVLFCLFHPVIIHRISTAAVFVLFPPVCQELCTDTDRHNTDRSTYRFAGESNGRRGRGREGVQLHLQP